MLLSSACELPCRQSANDYQGLSDRDIVMGLETEYLIVPRLGEMLSQEGIGMRCPELCPI